MKCKRCEKKPSELDEYKDAAEANGCTPEQFVRAEEGTYNPMTQLFYCTACYIAVGQPLGVA